MDEGEAGDADAEAMGKGRTVVARPALGQACYG